jgi:hypothetical protein
VGVGGEHVRVGNRGEQDGRNEALQQARRTAAELAATRGWNPRIVTETGRALAVVLADHIPAARSPGPRCQPRCAPGT